jgi:protein-L-isoaspartate(D-aspartate) O-methyltransferase
MFTNPRRLVSALIVLPAVLLVLAAVPHSAPAQPRDRYQAEREAMVRDFLIAEGIQNRRVLSAMLSVPRHEFVERSMRAAAYRDAALAIGHGQTISPPFIVAYMTETIDPQPTDKVLEIGTGSGYQAAVLSGLVDEVYTIEIVEPLGESAAKRLKDLGYDNVHAKVGDGYQGWPEHAPFDKIIVTCSPEKIPVPLAEQLKEGGKMIIPLGERYQQVFHLLEKRDGKLVQEKLIPTLFVPMTGVSEKNRQVQPDPLHPQIVGGGFEEDENADGRPDHWHYQRQTEHATGGHSGSRAIAFTSNEPGRLAQALQGMGLDGRDIAAIRVRAAVKYEETHRGPQRWEAPGLMLHFYDEKRRTIDTVILGPWLGTQSSWEVVSQTVPVPAEAREAIVRIGLNGGTGTLSVDDVELEVTRRR